MTGPASQVWIGDLARALGVLAPRDQTTATAIAAALGLAHAPVRHSTGASDAPEASVRTPEAAASAVGGLTADRPGEGEPEAPRAAELAYLRTEKPDTAWLPSVKPIGAAGRAGAVAAPSPLLEARVTRGVLGAALSTHDEHGPVDVAAAVELLARGRSLDALPHRRWPTLRHGAQVLLDGGEGMTPFAADARELVAEMRRHVGQDRLAVLRFVGCPTRGAGVHARRTWSAWTPPRPGSPIALITDLGIARPPFSADPAPVAEWLGFAEHARRAGCPVVAFVPYRSGRVPAPLRRALAIVPWSERTSATRVRAAIGGVLRRPV